MVGEVKRTDLQSMFLELPETSPKYLVSGYIVVADRAGAQKPMLFKEGISAADYAAVLARDGFTISDSSMAIDAAALFAALSSIVNADGWLLIVEPKVEPSGGQWPQGRLLPQEVQQKIPAVSARKAGTRWSLRHGRQSAGRLSGGRC